MKANIKLEIKTLTPVRLAGLMSKVHQAMDGNPAFPTPPVSMADLKAKYQAYIRAISEATEGSRLSKYVRDDIGAEAKDMLRQLADYVRIVALGDATMLAQSGFPLARVPQPIGHVGTPQMQRVAQHHQPGSVLLRWSGIHGRRGYQVYMTDVDPASGGDVPWTLQSFTGKVRHSVEGLTPFKPYWFCVSAIGPLGEGERSQPVLGHAV
ncbi:MAG TPA: fibronectin type III domain-containing protein [Flavobacteriales bacterium]|nr:fibronectin type III domain-containing protein [Flavobacteriales bacterium]